MSVRLDRTERRVVGSLIEKGLSVPEAYPLSLNALVLACNQKSNRDPEMDLAEHEVFGAARALADRGWVEEVDPPTGRVRRYAHRAGLQLGVDDQDLAILAELLLRGPQTVPELERRCERMRRFAGPEEVERRLEGLAARPVPYARRLERRPGERVPRWEHLLGAEPEGAGAAAPAAGAAEAPSPAHDLLARVERLESDVADLRARVDRLLRPPN